MKKIFCIIIFILSFTLHSFAGNIIYKFSNIFSISISDLLELQQNENDSTFYVNDTLNYVTKSEIKIDVRKTDKRQEIGSNYCKISFKIFLNEDKQCPYPYSFNRSFSFNNLKEIVDSCKNSVPFFSQSKPTAYVDSTDNGAIYIQIIYPRLDNPNDSCVSVLYFFNYKYSVKATFIYQANESNIWHILIYNAINSFVWTNPIVPLDNDYKNSLKNYSNSIFPNGKEKGICFILCISLVLFCLVIGLIKINHRKDYIDFSEPNKDNSPIDNNIKIIPEHSICLQEDVTNKNSNIYIVERNKNDNNKDENIYTRYSIEKCKTLYYCYFTAPDKNTIVYPHRNQKVERRGYTEQKFEEKLKYSFKEIKNYEVLGNVSIHYSKYNHPYEPDIAIIENGNKYGIRIDIEIDEPYDGINKKPIHFIGCGDSFRDKMLAKLGWIVIRFSEKQIFIEPNKCINYIKEIISRIDDSIISDSSIFPTMDKCWTEFEAKSMLVNKQREKLLNHEFGDDKKNENRESFDLNENEKNALQKVKSINNNIIKPQNIDESSISFPSDSNLYFDPIEHIYAYDNRQLAPVSCIIDKFFIPFDSLEHSKNVALRENRNQCEVLEDWDCKGLESREIGTFLHSQIESYFNEKKINENMKFAYSGNYIRENKTISINEEIKYFKSLLSDYSLYPFRTEWHICDLDLGVAGTIDLLCKNGKKYDIYDWKRSKKASPDEQVFKYGINGLEKTPDIRFYHYAIQLNLYRYIIEKNYGLLIDNMYIVIFHPSFSNYIKCSITKMDQEIQTIINKL